MGLEPAIEKSWYNLIKSGLSKKTRVKFLADEYLVDPKLRNVQLSHDSTPAEDHLTILILHYLSQKVAGLPKLIGEYLSFSELSAVGGFSKVFKKRCTDLILNKFGNDPSKIFLLLHKLPGKKTNQADASIMIDAFEGVPVIIEIWASDEEFGPDVNILFDRSITKILCVEDIVVMAEVISRIISSQK